MKKIAADRNYYLLRKKAEEGLTGPLHSEQGTPIGSDRYNRHTGKLTLESFGLREPSGIPFSETSLKNPFGSGDFASHGVIVLPTHDDNRSFFRKNPAQGEYGSFTDQNDMQLMGTLYHTDPSLGAAIVFKDSRAHLPEPKSLGEQVTRNTMDNFEYHMNELEKRRTKR